MARKKALITGGLGVIGGNLIDHMANLSDWDIIAVSRRAPDAETAKKAQFISCDLLNREETEARLGKLTDITHLFSCALYGGIDATTTQQNRAMLVNPVEVVSSASTSLERVILQEGSKYYGRHLGPFKTPAKESDERHIPPNFYYDQEDFLIAYQSGKNWTWTALRPDAVCGFAIGNPMNLVRSIAVYAALSKAFGMSLRYPGELAAYNAIAQVTDAGLLARGTTWAATSPKAANQPFNVTNGDAFRYIDLWPQWAEFFDMPVGTPQRVRTAEMMADKGPIWETIVEKHGLHHYAYQDLGGWEYFDFNLDTTWDVMYDNTKRIQAGFTEVVDTEDMFLRLLGEYRRRKVIP